MIHVCEPQLGEEELRNVQRCIESSMISGGVGQYIREFEEKFSSYCGKRYGVTTTSGTTALHLAIASLGIGKGDEVITSTLTNVATVFAIVYTGAKPVVVDSEAETWNMDETKIEEKITKRTKAILPVHIYGHPCNMDPITQIAKKHALYVIEDAAEAHGAEYKGRKAGGIGDVGCFSFYANKIITTGEGGMIVTDDPKIAEKARTLKDLAFSKETRFLHYYLGFNYRMTNMQAAIGVAQFGKIDEFIQKKRRIARLYNSLLEDLPGITLPCEKPWAKNVYWMYCILIEDGFGMNRDQVMTSLAKAGIETRTLFIPMNRQPVFHKMGLFADESCPVAEGLSRKGFYLPSGVGLSDDQIKYVCRTIRGLGRSKPHG